MGRISSLSTPIFIMIIISACYFSHINPLNAELNPICHFLALLGVHHFLHVSRIRVKSLNLRLLMSYIYIYDISSLRVKEITNSCCLLGSYDLVILGVIRPL